MEVIEHETVDDQESVSEKRALSEEAIMALRKLECDFEIGRLGLQGTLWGAWAALVAIILIVFAPVVTKKDIVEGWQLVIIVALIVGAVVFYGAFVFNRALKISVRTDKYSVGLHSPKVQSLPEGEKEKL